MRTAKPHNPSSGDAELRLEEWTERRYVPYPAPPQPVQCKVNIHLGFTSFTNKDNGAADYTRRRARVK